MCYADRTLVKIGGQDGPEVGRLSVTIPGVGDVALKILNGSSAECTGNSAPCFFDIAVLKPFINNSGLLDYKPARDPDYDALTEAFRNG